MPYLLKKIEWPWQIDIHSDPLSIIPSAISRERAYKLGQIVQEEMQDNSGGAAKCLLCNPELLDGKPQITTHLDGKVMSFPNAAPFLPGDQRVLCLWHDSGEMRYLHAHKFKFADFGIQELYYLTCAAVELAKEFLDTPDCQILQNDPNGIRSIAGFNLGRLAGQSIPHFHLQYGWDIVVDPRPLNDHILDLFYSEMKQMRLILHEDQDFYVVVPWTPKGQYHLEFHFKYRYELSQLKESDVKKIAFFGEKVIRHYQNIGIENLNILFTGSPYRHHWEPFRVQFVPRVNVPALYEMMGVNVVDTPPEKIEALFSSSIRWKDIEQQASSFDATNLYCKRFDSEGSHAHEGV